MAATPAQLVAHLDDQVILRSYCEFNTMYRALAATGAYDSRAKSRLHRRAAALEIATAWIASIEDLAMLIIAFGEWDPGNNLLFDVLDKTQIREDGGQNSTEAVLATVMSWSPDQIREGLGLPSEETLRDRGFRDEEIAQQRQSFAGFRDLIARALSIRLADESVAVSSYNKIKHGVLAICSTLNSEMGVSFLLSARRGPKEPALGGRQKINSSWLPCDDRELRALVLDTILVCKASWYLVNLMYLMRFDRKWQMPEWPINIEDWID
jgi:hypothetical protein